MKGCFYLSDLLQGLSLSDLHFGGSRIKLGNLEEAGSYMCKVHLLWTNVGASTTRHR